MEADPQCHAAQDLPALIEMIESRVDLENPQGDRQERVRDNNDQLPSPGATTSRPVHSGALDQLPRTPTARLRARRSGAAQMTELRVDHDWNVHQCSIWSPHLNFSPGRRDRPLHAAWSRWSRPEAMDDVVPQQATGSNSSATPSSWQPPFDRQTLRSPCQRHGEPVKPVAVRTARIVQWFLASVPSVDSAFEARQVGVVPFRRSAPDRRRVRTRQSVGGL